MFHRDVNIYIPISFKATLSNFEKIGKKREGGGGKCNEKKKREREK